MDADVKSILRRDFRSPDAGKSSSRFHVYAALGEEVERALRERFEGRSFSLLDLGCGDAHVFAPILRRISPSSYKGIDLSETALARAAENLKSLPCPVQLAHSDMLSALSDGVSYDSSTAVRSHHLSPRTKRFSAARLALAPAACCCWSTRCAGKAKRAMTI
jgi:SAM-dependent methyltransferase